MSRRRRGFLTSLCLSIVLVTQLKATDESGGRAAGNSGSSSASNPSDPELQVIRDRMAKQQEEIKKLQQALDEQKVLLEKALERLAAPKPGGPETVRAEMAPASGEAKLIPVNVAHPRIAAGGDGRTFKLPTRLRSRSRSETRRSLPWDSSISPGTDARRTSEAASALTLAAFRSTIRRPNILPRTTSRLRTRV